MELSRNRNQWFSSIGIFQHVLIDSTSADFQNLNEEEISQLLKDKVSDLDKKMIDVLEKVSQELTTSAYSQSDTDEDYADHLKNLETDLILIELTFISNDEIQLIFTAPTQYPDYTIYCHLDQDLNLEDCIIE